MPIDPVQSRLMGKIVPHVLALSDVEVDDYVDLGEEIDPNNGYGTSGWWDYQPDQLWRLPPAHVCPLTRRETEMLSRGSYPASLWDRVEPPEKLPSDDPWIVRDPGKRATPTRRDEHYGYK